MYVSVLTFFWTTASNTHNLLHAVITPGSAPETGIPVIKLRSAVCKASTLPGPLSTPVESQCPMQIKKSDKQDANINNNVKNSVVSKLKIDW